MHMLTFSSCTCAAFSLSSNPVPSYMFKSRGWEACWLFGMHHHWWWHLFLTVCVCLVCSPVLLPRSLFQACRGV
jgi:hypothetical protein